MLAAASNEQPAFAWRTQVRHCVGCLWEGGAARALAARARRAALVVIGRCPMEGHCSGEKPLLSTQDRAPTCQLWPLTSSRLSRDARRRATALAICGEEAQHARSRLSRAVPRGLWSADVLQKGTVPVRSLSRSVQDRAPTCQLRPLTSSRLSRGARKCAAALAVCGEEAQHAGLRHACAVPR